jgi:hypothetical protein
MVREIDDDDASNDDDDLDDLDDQEMDPLWQDEDPFNDPDNEYNGQLMAPVETLTPLELDSIQSQINQKQKLISMCEGTPGTYSFNCIPHEHFGKLLPSCCEVTMEGSKITVEVFDPKDPKDQRKIETSKLHGRFKGIFGNYESGTA